MKSLLFFIVVFLNTAGVAVGEERAVEFVKSVEEVEGYLTKMRQALPTASCSEAIFILNGYIDVLAKYKDNENTLFYGKAFYGDKAVTLIRMAKVVEVEGSATDARKYRAEAKAACEKAQWKSCDAETIERVVSAMNKELKIGCIEKGHVGT